MASNKASNAANVAAGIAKKTGRPSKYNDAVLKKLPELIQLGLSDRKIAELLGITPQLLVGWKKDHPELLYTYNIEKAKRNANVVNNLYKRATGVTTREVKRVEKEDGTEVQTVVEKEHPPDTEAAKFWLTNNDPEFWKYAQPDESNQQQAIQVVVNIPRPGNKEGTVIDAEQITAAIPRPQLNK